MEYEIGDEALGGIIGYIFKRGEKGYNINEQHGFVVAKEDQGIAIWGDKIDVPTSYRMGKGYDNTQSIIAHCTGLTTAANLCVNYSGGGYTDWFLPSKLEAFEFVILHWEGFCNFNTGKTEDDLIGKYYTSSQVGKDFGISYNDYHSAFSQYINYDPESWNYGQPTWQNFGGLEKDTPLNVRAIRYF